MLVLLALPFVFFASNAKEAREHNWFDRAVVTVSLPIQWLMATSLETVSDVWHGYFGLVGAQERAQALALENAELRRDLELREEERLETERLRSLLGLKRRVEPLEMRHARVIALSPSPLFRSVRIDKGTHHGVSLGDAVVTNDGVVGRVAAVSPFAGDVMLIADVNASIDVLVQRSRAHARVRGSGGDDIFAIRVDQMARTADVEPGDDIITSGLGGVYPKGLRVGRVISVEKRSFGLYQNATVDPAVDLARIEDVLVIVGEWPRESSFERLPSPLLEAPQPRGDVAGGGVPWRDGVVQSEAP